MFKVNNKNTLNIFHAFFLVFLLLTLNKMLAGKSLKIPKNRWSYYTFSITVPSTPQPSHLSRIPSHALKVYGLNVSQKLNDQWEKTKKGLSS